MSGKNVLAPGPGHSKGDRSLSILIDPDAPDGFVITSFAGNDVNACRDHVRQALGLPSWQPTKKKDEKQPPKVVERYLYKLADGAPYLRVTRLEPKSFRQEHFDADGLKWVSGKPSGEKIPYGLPELLENTDEPIWLVAGEKAVNYLRQRSVLATCFSEGENKFDPSQAQWFDGRDLIVVPDNDGVGRKFAAQVKSACPQAIILNLPNPPRIGAGADDWIEAGNTIDDLWKLALDPPDQPQDEPAYDPHDDDGVIIEDDAPESNLPAKRFKREKFEEIEPAKTEWLIKHFLPARGVGIVYGKSTVGKSFLVLSLCLKVARGEDFLGHKTRQSGVLYFAAEGQNGMRKRIKAVRDKLGVHAPAFQFIGDTLNLMDPAEVDALSIAAIDARDEMAIDNLELGLIVIDTTAASMPGGNENAGEDMSVVLQSAQKIGDAANCAVMFIAHPGKNETLGVRGWSGQVGNVDAVYYIACDEEDPLLRVGTVQKLKDGEDGERFAYRLEQIQLGIDEDGDAITSAYPVFEDVPNTSSRKRKRPEDRPGPAIILRAINQMIDHGQASPAPRVAGAAPDQMAVFRRDIRERALQLGYADPDDTPDAIKRAINRDLSALIAANTIREEGSLVWPIR